MRERMAKVKTFSTATARKALAAVHGFLPGSRPRGKAGALAVARRLSAIQTDPLDVAGRIHDLTLQSRVDGYKPKHLYELLYKDRALFDYYCKMASIMPIEAWPEFGAFREHWSKKLAPFFKDNARETKEVLRALEDGPVSSKGYKGAKKVDWAWGKTNVYKVVLEHLFLTGKVIIHSRDGWAKTYGLAEKYVPRALLEEERPGADYYRLAVTRRICHASRIVTPFQSPEQWSMVGKSTYVGELLARLEREGEIFRFQLEGWKGPVYAPAEDEAVWTDPPEQAEAEAKTERKGKAEVKGKDDWCRFLAPLDPLLWNRRLFATIYKNEYTWEVYKQEKDRKYGYYCLPVIYNGDYAALIEPWYDKKEKTLEIRSFHVLDTKTDKRRMKKAVSGELDRFAEYVGSGKTLAAESGLLK